MNSKTIQASYLIFALILGVNSYVLGSTDGLLLALFLLTLGTLILIFDLHSLTLHIKNYSDFDKQPFLFLPLSKDLFSYLSFIQLNQSINDERLLKDKDRELFLKNSLLKDFSLKDFGKNSSSTDPVEHLLKTLSSHFRANVSSIVFLSPDKSSFKKLSIGLNSSKFISKLTRFLKNYFNYNDKSMMGIIDLVNDYSVNPFIQFDISSYLALPITWRSTTNTMEGVLFLGARSRNHFNREDKLLLREFIRKVEVEFEAIEESRALNSELEIKNNYLSSISHDYRTPLNNLNLLLSDLDKAIENKDKQTCKDILNTASESCEIITRYSQNAMDFLLSQSNALKPNKKSFPIVERTRSIAKQFNSFVNKKELFIRIDNNQNLDGLMVNSDLIHFDRIISNILSNAVKYTSTGGISITFQATENSVTVHISDTGSGLLPEQIKNLFTPFRRFSKEVEGVGLGLVVSKKLINLNNGCLNVRSLEGQGSTFSLTFERSFYSNTPQSEFEKRSILIVDDDYISVKSTATILRERNFDVRTSYSLKDALNKIKNSAPHIILSDFHLGDGNVETISNYLKSEKIKSKLIVISGSFTALSNKLFDVVLQKPVSKNTLLDHLKKFE